MTRNTIVPDNDWTQARIELLNLEKELMRKQDELTRRRRSLPWRRVDKRYLFQATDRRLKLAELFGDCSQLVVYHFMFGPDSSAGCQSCSLVTDSLDPTAPHLRARDVRLVLASRAPIEKLEAFRSRMGWTLPWFSTIGEEFSRDFQALVTPDEPDGLFYYNYQLMNRYPPGDQPGLSVFRKDAEGTVFHTYSSYARGLELVVGTYSLLDLVPKGRDEDALAWPMAWVRHHDSYETGDSA